MSLFYRIAYAIGFTPWEVGLKQESVARQINARFDAEGPGAGRKALDLGCGSGIHSVALAQRGWDVTGVDNVSKALETARARAEEAGVNVRFIEGDITALHAAKVGEGYRLILDFGAVHGLTPPERKAVGSAVAEMAAPDAVLVMFAFPPGHRPPFPRGMSREDIQAIYPDWTITEDEALAAKLPWFLKATGANPHWYRLQRVQKEE